MLAHSSEVLQRFGVAWEQVADLDSNLSFQSEYTQTRKDLRKVSNIIIDFFVTYFKLFCRYCRYSTFWLLL